MKKKKYVTCCLSIILTPLLVCGLYNGAIAIYITLTELPYNNEVVDSYTLFPAETTGAAILTDLKLREDPRLKTIFPYHTPHIYIDSLLASAQLQVEDVSELTLFEVDYNSAALLIYTQQARVIFDNLQTQGFGQVDNYNDSTLYMITSPHAKGYRDDLSSLKRLEPWAWALVNDGLLVVGGVSTVENILDIYHDRRPSLVEARPIMKNIITVLRDKPNVYYSIRRENDIALAKNFVRVLQFFMGPFYALLEAASMEAGAFAAEDVEDGCISIMGTQMPSRTSAAILSSPFKMLSGLENLRGPSSLNWYADSVETVRINNVMLTKVYWSKENCKKIRAEQPLFVFPQ